jgi:Reverse transcriptase (RNA-dependent DNA polymerase)
LISLLSIFDKLLEKLKYFRLYNQLQQHKLLYEYQFGFRVNYSTSLALIEVLDKIYDHLDDGKMVCGVHLDLQKAFYTVSHDILLAKLVIHGVRGIVHDWFKSGLHNRQQFTNVCNVSSQMCTINVGVPLGSVLGPQLFLICINDIGSAVPCEKVKLFADDTNLFVSYSSISSVNNKGNTCMKLLNSWFVANSALR